MFATIVSNVWYGIPFFTIMITAALRGVPAELYEAASVDGASPIQQFWNVTIPSIQSVLTLTLLLRVIWIFNFPDLIYSMTNGGPANSTRTLSVYVYQEASNLNMGFASAMALMLMACLLIVAVPYL